MFLPPLSFNSSTILKVMTYDILKVKAIKKGRYSVFCFVLGSFVLFLFVCLFFGPRIQGKNLGILGFEESRI